MGLKLRLDGLDFTQNKPGHLLIHYPAAFFEKMGNTCMIHNPICYQDRRRFVGALQLTAIHPMVTETGFFMPG